MSGIGVVCVCCDYETTVFESQIDDGVPCPFCTSETVAKLDALFDEHPVPVVDDTPGLVRPNPNVMELREDFEKILPIAEEHGVIDDA